MTAFKLQRWLSRKQLSERTSIPYQTLSNWHSCEERGPIATRLSPGVLRYAIEEVLAWEADPAAYDAARKKRAQRKAKA